jgi:hypothetical protein
LPPGLRLIQVQAVDERLPALQVELQATDYTVTLLEHIPELPERIQALLLAESLPRRRRGKDYDLRPLILALGALPEDDAGWPAFVPCAWPREGATLA